MELKKKENDKLKFNDAMRKLNHKANATQLPAKFKIVKQWVRKVLSKTPFRQ